MSLLNQLYLLESYALTVFVYNLKLDIGQYLRLFKPTLLTKKFTVALEIEDIVGPIPRKNVSMGSGCLPKPLLPDVKGYTQNVSTNSPGGYHISKNLIKALSQSKMEERRKKGIFFWCITKYTPGHKCVKS